MSTLAPQKISITLPGKMATFLRKRAEAEDVSIDDALAAVIGDAMEYEEDEISDEEDAYFSKLGDERVRTATEFVSMEEFRRAVNAL